MKRTGYNVGIDGRVIFTLPYVRISQDNYPIEAAVVDWNGTVTDSEGNLRRDVKPFLKRRKEEGKLIAIASDMHPDTVCLALQKHRFKPDFFDAYFCCQPFKRKDVRKISEEIGVDPKHLIIFGDNHYIDLSSAKRAGSATVLMRGVYGDGVENFRNLEWIFDYSK
ncbi:HAD family hydrolase [Candidatus Woesearchaeota archaeon]|nr:HAD family hydrolase [Candidatus Woesearchaeota archaeon]